MTNDALTQFSINEAARKFSGDGSTAQNMGGCLGCIGAIFGVKVPNEINGPVAQFSSPGITNGTVDGFQLFKETGWTRAIKAGFPQGGSFGGQDSSEISAPAASGLSRTSSRSDEGVSI
jgi:hypothetical protein